MITGIVAALLSTTAFATTTIQTVANASDYVVNETGQAIYGGMAGTTTSCQSSGALCDTCALNSGTLAPCNFRSIYPSLRLQITGKTTDSSLFNNASATILMKYSTGTATSSTHPDGSGLFTFDVPWDQVCSMVGNASCASDFSGTVQFGPSKNGTDIVEPVSVKLVISVADNTDQYTQRCEAGQTVDSSAGFCFMQIFPGDGKVYIDGPQGDSLLHSPGFPAAGTNSEIKWNRLVVFYGEGKAASQVTTSDPSVTISYDNSVTNPDIDARVDGLTNDADYCFIMANQDVAGNIARFTDASEYASDASTILCGRPSLVVGLLDDKKCFIATAAFGSPLDPHVSTLRLFRDRFLKTNELGRRFVETYYHYSPRIARYIAQNENAKMVVRAGLWPFVGFASLALSNGLASAFAVVAGCSLLLGTAIVSLRRRRRKDA